MADPVSATPAAPPKPRRKYTKRVGEFASLSVDQLQAKKAEVASQLKALKAKPQDEAAVAAKKDLVNTQVRIYKQLRSLGVNSGKIRSEKAAAKKAAKVAAAPAAPAAETPKA